MGRRSFVWVGAGSVLVVGNSAGEGREERERGKLGQMERGEEGRWDGLGWFVGRVGEQVAGG